MCDYSLEHVASRAARVRRFVGDDPIHECDHARLRGSRGARCRGLHSSGLGPLALRERDVEYDHPFGFFPGRKLCERVARFRQINIDDPFKHHDALEFASGHVVLLTRLCEGQRATVLQLPALGASEGAEGRKWRRPANALAGNCLTPRRSS